MEKSNKDKGLLSNIINIYNLIQSALDIVEKDDTETSKEVAGYLYTMMDNISDMDSNNKLGLALENKKLKIEDYEKVNAPSDAMITAVQKVVDSLDKNNLLDENTFQLECLKQYKEEAQLDKLASTKEREQVKQLAMEQYKQLKKEIRLAKQKQTQEEQNINSEEDNMEEKEIPVEENKELKTEAKSSISKLKKELEDVVKSFMTKPEIGFDESDVNDYSTVVVTWDKENVIAEVRAELEYETMMELSEVVNKVVSKYDKDSYFDNIDSGIIRAIIDNSNKNILIESDEPEIESKSIKQEYLDYCNDKGLKVDSNKSKTLFMNDYSRHYVQMNGIKDLSKELDRVQDEISNIEIEENKNLQESKLQENKETILASITPEDEAHFEEENDKLARQEVEDMLNNDKKEPDEEIEKELDNIEEGKEKVTEDTPSGDDIIDYSDASTFEELEEIIEDIYAEGTIDDDEYDRAMDMLQAQQEATESYIIKRSEVTNTDYEDEMGIIEENVQNVGQRINTLINKLRNKKEEGKEVIKEGNELSVNQEGVETFVNKNQYGYTTIGILVDDGNMKYALVDGQTLPTGKYKKLSKTQIREMAEELDTKGYERVKMYGSLEESKLTEVKSNDELEKEFGMGWAQLPDRFIGNIYDFISQWYEEDPEELEDMEPEDILDQFKDEHGLDDEDIETYEDWYITYIQYTLNKVMGNKNKEELGESKKVTESNTIVNDENIDAVKDNFNPPGTTKKTEAEMAEDERDEKIFNNMENETEDRTLLDMLQDRVGQKISVGEINSVLQSLFAKYDTIFIKTSELYNYEPDEEIETVIWDVEDMYTIQYHVTDLDYKTIEIDDVNLD